MLGEVLKDINKYKSYYMNILIAKLKNQLELIVQVSPTKTEKRIVDSFYVMPINYTLLPDSAAFQVYFMKETPAERNPASGVSGEDLTIGYKLEKVFMENMKQEELASWGADDKSLYDIFAAKYEVEIEKYVETDSLRF